MSNMTVATVLMMDNDDKLKGKSLNLIHKFEDVVIEVGEPEQTTLLKLAVNNDIKAILAKHNEKRTQVVNSVTLERTGREVKLSPVTIEDVTVIIK